MIVNIPVQRSLSHDIQARHWKQADVTVVLPLQFLTVAGIK
jgi:hypothetical protein